MSLVDSRDTRVVIETPWERLRRLIDLRRDRLDLTLAGIDAVGGPSPKWVHLLNSREGLPSERMRSSLSALDRALQWPEGTSWSLVSEDRSEWSEVVLQDEEQSLLEVHDEADHFGYEVAHRLRAIPQARRDEVMRKVFEAMDWTGEK